VAGSGELLACALLFPRFRACTRPRDGCPCVRIRFGPGEAAREADANRR